MVAQQVNYVDNNFDQVALAVTPTLMKPIKGDISWELNEGAYRYIMAKDGLYIEGKSALLHASFKISDLGGRSMPYGEHKPFCNFTHGLPAARIYHEIIENCVNSKEQEYACNIRYGNASYFIDEPATISRSAGHISYVSDKDVNNLLVDVHSHGFGKAYFSGTDDKSDEHGIYIAMVLGRCGSLSTIEAATRIVIHGHFCDLPWTPFEEAIHV